MPLSNFVRIWNCFKTLSKLVGRVLVGTGIAVLAFFCGCTSLSPGGNAVVPHPIKGEIGLYMPPAEMAKEDFVAFYALYTQAYEMENKQHDLHSALALYQDAAKYKSPVIKPEDRAAVESKIAELRANIASEN